MYHYAYNVKGKTIHYYVQLVWYKNDVDDKSSKVNGCGKLILTHEEYIFSLRFSQLFIYLPMRTYYSTEQYTLTNVILISYTYSDHIVIYFTKAENDACFVTVSASSKLKSHGPFDIHG